MKYILDSDTITYLYDTKFSQYQAVRNKFEQLKNYDVVQVSFITLFELEYSLYNAPDDKKEGINRRINYIEKTFEVIPIQKNQSSIYGKIKADLKRSTGNSTKGMRKYNIDLIVASTAISESSILVANDEIYKKLAEIDSRFQYENWTL